MFVLYRVRLEIARGKVLHSFSQFQDWKATEKNCCGFRGTFSKSIGHSSIRTTMEIYAHLGMTQNRYIPRSLADLKDF